MRSFIIAVVVTIALATACVTNVHAVGMYRVGKEECNCSPLVAKGIIPDPLNKLKEALVCSQLALVLDRIVVEIKGIVGQFGVNSAAASEEAVKKGEEAPELKARPAIEKIPRKEEFPAKEEKPAIEKKSIKGKKPAVQLKKDQKKKRRVKIPPKVT